MSEALADYAPIPLPERKNSLRLVKEIASRVIPACVDETGKVIYPAIVKGTHLMPNGQTVESFFERDGRDSDEVERLTNQALARAKTI